ncbi:MAG: hypothetical protein K0S33_3856 [Bacteroidetes bacterium]|nr:hypothetical protein [Bacteroidota bacterium]
MKQYLSQDEMLEASWLLAKVVVDGSRSKKKLSKEEFKKEFMKEAVYTQERKKIRSWLDAVLLDSTRYNWKEMNIVSVQYRSVYDELSGEKKLSHQDSVKLKSLPPLRMLNIILEDNKQAWSLELLQLNCGGSWKFMERPRMKYSMKQELLDTMFRAALKACFVEKTMKAPYVLVCISDSASHESCELALTLQELEKYMLYLRKYKEIAPEDVFKVYSRHLVLAPEFYTYLKDKYYVDLKESYHFAAGTVKNSARLLEMEKEITCDPATVAWYFRRGILLSCEPQQKLLVLNVDLGP